MRRPLSPIGLGVPLADSKEHSGGSSSQHSPRRSSIGLGVVLTDPSVTRFGDYRTRMEGSSSVHGPLPESIAPLERKLNDHVYELYKAKGEPTLEILFFHGLQIGHGANAYRSTWMSGDGPSQQVWPATWLVEEFPDSHIFSMSYDSEYDSKLNLDNLVENLMHAITWHPGIGQGCPVILVGHSFGGLVIKALCVKADQTYSLDPHSETSKKIGRFLHNAAGIFFYATPHQGIHSIGKLGAYLLDGPNDGHLLDYIKSLSADSARLDDIFCHVRRKYKVWHIASAGESLPTSWGHFNDLVVPEASARYGEQFTMINADHISICKPSGKTSNSFQHLVNFITMVQKDEKDSSRGRQHSQKSQEKENRDSYNRCQDPLTWEKMSDPVMCSDGRTYDRWTIIDRRISRSPYIREMTDFSILGDNVDVRSELFEEFPEQQSVFRERRKKYREEALQHARANPVEFKDAVEKLKNVIKWLPLDTECKMELDEITSRLSQQSPLLNRLPQESISPLRDDSQTSRMPVSMNEVRTSEIPVVMHEDVIRARLDEEGARLAAFLVLFYVVVMFFVI